MIRDDVLDMWLAMMRNPPASNQAGAALERQVAEERITLLDKAKVLRPYFLPVLTENQNYTILLNGVVNGTESRYTPPSTSDFLAVASISDMDVERVRFFDAMGGQHWSDFAAPARSVSGLRPGLVGFNGYIDLEEPFKVGAGNQIGLDIVNVGGLAVRRWFVFQGLKVNTLRDVSLDVFDPLDKRAITNIRDGIPPRNVQIVLEVPFTGAGDPTQRLANLTTKAYGEPLLIKAISTSLNNCAVQITDSNDQQWSPIEVPIWSVAAHNNTAGKRPKERLRRPVYLAGGMELRADFYNQLDPTRGADVAGTVTFHCSTP